MNQPIKPLFGGSREFCIKDPRKVDLFAIVVENKSPTLLAQYPRIGVVAQVSQSEVQNPETGRYETELKVKALTPVTEVNTPGEPIEFNEECSLWCKEPWLQTKLADLIDEWAMKRKAGGPLQELMEMLAAMRQGEI